MALLLLLLSALLLTDAASGTTTLACPDGFTLVGLRCFLVSPEAHSGSAAAHYCQGRNASAAVVESREEMDLLKESFLKTTVHLGVNLRKHREEIFQIALKLEGYTGFTSFGLGEPDNYGGEDCVVAQQTRGYDWQDARCEETHPVLCSTPPIVEDKKLCRDGAYKYSASTCFWADSTVRYTWDDARATCVAHGGDLASIHSSEENDFLSGMIDVDSWTGLNDIESNAHFKWTDGSPLDFAYWSPYDPEPDNTTAQNCVRMLSGNGVWTDWDCADLSGVLCKEATF